MNVPHDPRLTAYALGELSREEEGEVESLLQRDAAAREEVAAIRETASWLQDELAGPGAPALSGRRRASIVAAAAALHGSAALGTAPERKGHRSWLLLAALALPAVVAVIGLRHRVPAPDAPVTAVPRGSVDLAAERAVDPRGLAAPALDAPAPGAAAAPQEVEPAFARESEAGPEHAPVVAPAPEPAVVPSEPPRQGELRLGLGSTDDADHYEQGEADDVGSEGGVVGSLVGGIVGGAAPPQRESGPRRLTVRAGQSLLAIDPNVSPYKVDLPEEYVQRGEQYHATIDVCVAADGTVSSVEILKPSIPIIDRQIPKVVPLWRYRPYLVDGAPTAFCYSTNYRVVRGP